MKVTIEFDGESLINDIMANYPEASSPSLRCISWKYSKCEYIFEDNETGKTHEVTMPMLSKALPKLLETMFRGHLAGIAQYVLPNFQDAGNWDCSAADALIQMAIFDDVIYG